MVKRLTDDGYIAHHKLTEDEWQELVLFAYANRNYFETLGPLLKLIDTVEERDSLLSQQQMEILRQKVEQHRSWEDVVINSGLVGQKQALKILRDTVKVLLQKQGPVDLLGKIEKVRKEIANQ